jgi:hypothetical protein
VPASCSGDIKGSLHVALQLFGQSGKAEILMITARPSSHHVGQFQVAVQYAFS